LIVRVTESFIEIRPLSDQRVQAPRARTGEHEVEEDEAEEDRQTIPAGDRVADFLVLIRTRRGFYVNQVPVSLE